MREDKGPTSGNPSRIPGARSRGFRILGKGLLLLLLLGSLVPYAFPLSREEALPRGPYPDSATFLVEDTAIHVRVQQPMGQEKGRVLLLHGLGGSTYSFRHTMAALVEAGYLVVAADLPGFGYSSRTPGFDHSQTHRSAVLWHLLDALEEERGWAPAPWVLLGHSMGGGTAAAMALQEPQRAEALVLVAGALMEHPRRGSLLLAYPPLSRAAAVILDRLLPGEERMVSLLASAYGRTPSAEELEGYQAPLLLPGTARSLTDMVRTARNVPLEALKDLTLPVLGIWGAEDAWVPPAQGEALRDILPSYTLALLPDAGHCPMETHPQAFFDILRAFLEGR